MKFHYLLFEVSANVRISRGALVAKDLKAKLQPDLHGLNIKGEKNKMSSSENQPPIAPAAPGEKPKVGTELTYQQLVRRIDKEYNADPGCLQSRYCGK